MISHGFVNVALRHLQSPNSLPEQDLTAEEPIDALRRCHAAFVDEVSRYPMDEAGARARFWLRRMTHEIAVHRVDGERAIGQAMGPIPSDLAIDGLLWLYGRGDDVAVEGDDALVAQVRRLLAKAMG